MSGDEDLLDAFLLELEGEHDGDGASGADLEGAGLLALLAEPVEPPRALRERIGASTRTTSRFDDLEEALGELIDLPPERVRELLLAVDGPDEDRVGAWQQGPGPGIHLLHFRGGPRVADAVTGFVRISAASTFPEHRHVGDEAVMVLQGAFRDSDGSVHRRGEIVRMTAGSEHSLVAIGPVPLCYAAVIHRGVVIGGELMTPDDPRA